MKILIVSQYFWPENFRVNDLSLGLKELGHEVTVLTGKPNYPSGKIFSDYISKPKEYLNYDGVEVVRVPIIPQGKNRLMRILNYLSFAFSATLIGMFQLQRKT